MTINPCHGSNRPPSNQGKLLLDATCAPADIADPTDLTLLNEVREKREAMIDVLHAASQPGRRRLRTYRQKARRAYLTVAKQRRVSPRALQWKGPCEGGVGAKMAISLVDGYARIEHLGWDSFHEGHTLQAVVEAYRERYGCYPEAVLADKVYRNRRIGVPASSVGSV